MHSKNYISKFTKTTYNLKWGQYFTTCSMCIQCEDNEIIEAEYRASASQVE